MNKFFDVNYAKYFFVYKEWKEFIENITNDNLTMFVEKLFSNINRKHLIVSKENKLSKLCLKN
jgi:hypothetical protein